MQDTEAAVICDVSAFSISILDVSDSEFAVLDESILQVANKHEISLMQQCSLRYFEIAWKLPKINTEKLEKISCITCLQNIFDIDPWLRQ